MSNQTNPSADGRDATELIDRYVHEVSRRLAPAQRVDVRRELRSSLLDALEDRFGPEPTWVQAAILLRETGPPREVAASYRPQDRYLVGPEWFPAFALVLRIVLTAYLGVLVVAFGIQIFVRGGETVGASLLGLLSGTLDGGLMIFAIVVAIFYLLQRTEKPPVPAADWTPEDLPPLRAGDVVSRGEAVLEVLLPALFLAGLYIFRDAIGIHLRSGGPVLLNDLFLAYLPWIAALILGDMAIGTLIVWRSRWTWPTRLVALALDAIAVAVFWSFALDVAGERGALLAAGVPEVAVDLVTRGVWTIPAIIAIVALVKVVKPLIRGARKTP